MCCAIRRTKRTASYTKKDLNSKSITKARYIYSYVYDVLRDIKYTILKGYKWRKINNKFIDNITTYINLNK